MIGTELLVVALVVVVVVVERRFRLLGEGYLH